MAKRGKAWQRMFGKEGIFSMIERGQVEQCRVLLRADRGASKQTDDLGRTPLHVAAFHGNKEIVTSLLACRADPHARDSNQATPLHWAAAGGRLEVIDALLRAGARIDALDADSVTPLRLATMRGHADTARSLRLRGAKE